MLLATTAVLAGCTGAGGPSSLALVNANGAIPVTPQSGAPPAPVARVAILLPLTGDKAPLGQALLNAAKLALAAPGAPALDVKDTAGLPDRAAAAAKNAISAGDVMILGPLTTQETAAVAAVAQPANVPVLAFTSDRAQARPGVWTLGITPAQQVRRLVAAARDEGHSRFAAVVPDDPFGAALADALAQAETDQGAAPVASVRYAGGFQGLNNALKQVSDFEARRGGREARIKALRASTDPATRQQARDLANEPVPPPPFDALLLGAAGRPLQDITSVLPYYDITQPQVRILGPALWARQAPTLGAIAGAWFAAPDPAARTTFEQAYQARYNGQTPPPLSDLAYDAAAIARVLGQTGGGTATLTRTDGFAGVDGVLALMPDGRVRRGLAVFEINQGGGAHIVRPAPVDLSSPGV